MTDKITAQVRVKPLEWALGSYVSKDDDGGPLEGVPVKLAAWRAKGYTIIRQRHQSGLWILRTPGGEGQIASHDVNVCKAAAQAHFLAAFAAAKAVQYG